MKASFPIFLLYFIDNFSLALVIPILSTVILGSQSHFIASSLFWRNISLAILGTAFPLALLFGAPLIGAISDAIGRKKSFYITITGMIIGNLLVAFAFYISHFTVLVLARLISGFFSGNTGLCLTAISDLNPDRTKRSKYFGYLTGIGGFSWLCAMFAGGVLANRKFDPYFSPSLPFMIAAFIGIVNLIALIYLFKETHHPKKKKIKWEFTKGPKKLIRAFRISKLRFLLLIQSLFLLSWMLVFQSFSSYSFLEFSSSPTWITLCLLGFSWILGSSLINRLLVKWVALANIPCYGLLALSLLFCIASFTQKFVSLSVFDCTAAFIASFTAANIFNLISFCASPRIQGEIMGLSQSVIAMVQIATPIVIGLFFLHYTLIYLTASGIALGAFLLFLFYKPSLQSKIDETQVEKT
ncbi:MAG: MFS transporter [Chlamydiales bacterium]|jgi:MFS family permease|nr:MFS transporter [Chlamydiales bacterium]